MSNIKCENKAAMTMSAKHQRDKCRYNKSEFRLAESEFWIWIDNFVALVVF